MRNHPAHLLVAWLVVCGAISGAARAADGPGPAQGSVSAEKGVRLVPIAPGYARNTVNVGVFRKAALVTHGQTQFAAFYDDDARVVLARRKHGSDAWEVKTTSLTGTAQDAHNAINIGVDGDGFVHVAWDHHNNPLNYRRGKEPLSLELVDARMTGENEERVTYPEFHPLPGGDLLMFYRDGGSGGGNLAINRYDVKTRAWRQLTAKLVDGEGERNAYWQACTDVAGAIHLSWVWRETPDVASNHDLCYAKSVDGGKTWQRSNGQPYALPITAATVEYAARIPEQHELINQTSMTADAKGRPYVATYFRPAGTDVPQYHLIYHDGVGWQTKQVATLTTPFRLGGHGTKRIPISRPQVVTSESNGEPVVRVVFRAEERGDRASLATCEDLAKGQWSVRDLTTTSLGHWEPSYDVTLWQREQKLHLFLQRAEQVDAEGVGALPPQMVYVAEADLGGRPGQP